MLCTLLTCGTLGATPPEDHIARFNSERYPERAAAQRELIEAAARQPGEVIRALIAATGSDSVEIAESSHETLQRIFEIRELGLGHLDPGFELSWFIAWEDAKITTYPHVIEVTEDSPAAAAGLKPGDVIRRCGDTPSSGLRSKTDLLRLMATLPEGTELVLKIGRMEFATDPMSRAIRSEAHEIRFHPAARMPADPLAEFPDDRFAEWIREHSAK